MVFRQPVWMQTIFQPAWIAAAVMTTPPLFRGAAGFTMTALRIFANHVTPLTAERHPSLRHPVTLLQIYSATAVTQQMAGPQPASATTHKATIRVITAGRPRAARATAM